MYSSFRITGLGESRKPDTHRTPIALLDEVGAKTVVISVGMEQKKYNHPDAHVFKAIRESKRPFALH